MWVCLRWGVGWSVGKEHLGTELMPRHACLGTISLTHGRSLGENGGI